MPMLMGSVELIDPADDFGLCKGYVACTLCVNISNKELAGGMVVHHFEVTPSQGATVTFDL